MGFKCLITVPPWNSDHLAISGGKDHAVTLDFKGSFECHLGANVALDCFRQRALNAGKCIHEEEEAAA